MGGRCVESGVRSVPDEMPHEFVAVVAVSHRHLMTTVQGVMGEHWLAAQGYSSEQACSCERLIQRAFRFLAHNA